MNIRTSRATPHAALWDALLDYHHSPGRHSVALREPCILFDNTLTVLMLAADRQMGLPGGQSPPEAVRQAARYFVRTAMLRPANDHYTLMGIKPETDTPTLREHFRLLIRLTHPDFLNEEEGWPADAAARVNRAHDVLTSPVMRAKYDAQQAPVTPPIRAATLMMTPKRERYIERSRPRTGVYVSAALALSSLGTLLLMWPATEDTSLTVMPTTNRNVALATAPVLDQALQAAVLMPARTQGIEPTVEVASSASPASKPMAVPTSVVSRKPVSRTALVNAPSHPLQTGPTKSTGEGGLSYAFSLPSEGSVTGSFLPDQSAPAAPQPAKTPPPIADTETLGLTMDRTQELGDRQHTRNKSDDMQKLQPVLTDLLHILGTGQSERVQVWAARNTGHDTSAALFASAYRQALAGAVVTGLGESHFELSLTNEQPVARGNVQIRLLVDNQQTQLRNFRLRAQFVMREDGLRLARLDAE
jgi:hypothetical protein